MSTNELALIEKSKAMDVFTETNGLDPFLDKIRKQIDMFVPDLKTAKGRKEIASMARKVANSKSYLEQMGKDLVTELKRKPTLIDAERRRMRNILDKWRDETRKPLTDWENAEKERVNKHEGNILHICAQRDYCLTGATSEMIKPILDTLNNITVNESWEEFEEQGHEALSETLSYVKNEYSTAVKHEEEQEELSRLRKEKEERDLKEREEKIAAEAAEKAKKEAAEKAKAVKEKARLREEELKLEKRMAEEEKDRLEKKAKQDAIDAKNKAEREKEEARIKSKKDAIEAKEKADKDQADAIENERLRVEREKKEEDRKEAARQADVNHRKEINNKILSSFQDNGINKDIAVMVITLAAQGKLENLIVRY